MEHSIGLILAITVAALAYVVGFDRDRAFYPTVLMVIASYYILFAAMGASKETVGAESVAVMIYWRARFALDLPNPFSLKVL